MARQGPARHGEAGKAIEQRTVSVNYYRHHIGDYLRDAAHLSLLEHGVYGRLLQVYYTREAPIADGEKYRVIGARSDDERRAVDSVLDEFFALIDGLWVQSRCDREIASYQTKAERNREVGKLGGNPSKKRGYNEPGHLYAIQREEGGRIKVGISKWPASRLSALKSQHGAIVVLGNAAVADMGAAEAAVHDAFTGRLDGEWIDATWAEVGPVFAAVTAEITVPSGHPNGSRYGALANSQEPIAIKEKERESASSAAPPSRGSRIPEGFPGGEEILWCMTERPDLSPQSVAAKFRDYWLGVPGAKGRKADWPATWRNFVRGERPGARASPVDRRDAETADFLGRLTGGLAGTKPQQKDAIDVEPALIRRIA